MNTEKSKDSQQTQFVIEHIVTLESSFAAKVAMYKIQEKWEPNAKMDLDVTHSLLADNHYEVLLTIDVNVKIKDDMIFTLKIKHAGCFLIQGYSQQDINHLLESFCPSIIYPYARKTVADLVTDAGFPPLHLNPVDFEARYNRLHQKENG